MGRRTAVLFVLNCNDFSISFIFVRLRMSVPAYVSVHGGHSGQFCNHATDTLEEVIQTYISKNFHWVGITEHAPAISSELLYRDQKEAGLTPDYLFERFGRYIRECRRLQKKYSDEITIFAAIEIETYSGYEAFVPHLVRTFSPDYLVGSVHFVNDLNFDYSAEMYQRAVAAAGGIDQLYETYFDIQYEMISLLRPAVVGHFDLIRIFDPNYRKRLEKPLIRAKIRRNLELIKEHGLIMDFNLRALVKGADEPYISRSILELVRDYEISVVPGDDSHGVSSVGNFMQQGLDILAAAGFTADWAQPARSY